MANLSFELPAGQTLALLGTSGSGKTTTLRMLNRLTEPTGGEIYVDGREIRTLPAHELRRRMGYVIQQAGLFPHYTVAENVSVVPALIGQPAETTRQRCVQLLDQLGLPPDEYAHKYPKQLSGGQQQRVGLARALAADPPIILMDEPFGALDPITRAASRQDFLELDAFRSKTIVLVTHDVEEAFELADLIAVLDQGQLQQLGPPRQLLFQPANDFVRDFFAAQRFGLQLRALTLAEVSPALEPLPDKPATFPNIDLKATVQRALDRLHHHPRLQLTNGQQLNLASLMGAFAATIRQYEQ